jgi:hypothetical protein
MRKSSKWLLPASIAGVAIIVAACAGVGGGGSGGMTFFISSSGSGNGADLGGLAGADQLCNKLASGAGASGKTWRAYLSTQGTEGAQTVNARDRIGKGPWHNAKGVMIASDVNHLHSESNNVKKDTALNEKGEMVAGVGDKPNRHDILTGSRVDGTAFGPRDPDMTCGNWTRSGTEGAVVMGHHDRSGPSTDAWVKSWNSSHQSRGGCSQKALIGTGGDGLIYCFAAN